MEVAPRLKLGGRQTADRGTGAKTLKTPLSGRRGSRPVGRTNPAHETRPDVLEVPEARRLGVP